MSTEIKNKAHGVMWLKKTGFDFDVLGGATPLNHQFGEGVFSFLEVLNEEKLEEDINGFVEQNKIQPCELFLVFDKSVVFEKEINTGDDFQGESTKDAHEDNDYQNEGGGMIDTNVSAESDESIAAGDSCGLGCRGGVHDRER